MKPEEKAMEKYKKNRQVALVLEKAEKWKMAVELTVVETRLQLKLTGPDYGVFDREARAWAKSAVNFVRTNKEKSFLIEWDLAFFAPPSAASTKPDGGVEDSDVLKLIPMSIIDSRHMLTDVLRDLDLGIEKAYPGIKLSDSGYGLGKKGLVVKVLDRLCSEGKVSRLVNDPASCIVLGLIRHFQVQDGEVLKGEQKLPAAQARSPDSIV